jgi:phosphatidylglycerol---prolipoprotein diacylglyceryl transferase
MRRVLFEIPELGVRVHSFGLALLVACLGAFYLTVRRARRERLDPDIVHGLAPWLFLGGLIGARIMFFVMNPWELHSVTEIFKFWKGGIIFYGCIVGGLVGSLIYCVRRPFPFRAMADAVAPALAFAIVVGRVGCCLNGCCHGSACDLPWAVSFPAGSLPWTEHVEAGLIPPTALHSLPVHPKQLYAALSGVVLFGLLTAYYPRRRRDGEVMVLLMITYPITRFLVEFYRGDSGGYFAGLSISQHISMALMAGGLAIWYLLSRLPEGRYADLAIKAPIGPATPLLRGPHRPRLAREARR